MKKIILIGLACALISQPSKAQDGASHGIGVVISITPYIGPSGVLAGSCLTFPLSTTLCESGANALDQKNGVNPQSIRVYNTYTDASNFERLNIGFSSNIAFIRTALSGTGVARALRLGTGGTDHWELNTSGNIVDQGTHTITAGSIIVATSGIYPGTSAKSGILSPTDGLIQLQNTAGTGFTRLILGTNDATNSGIGLANNAGGLDILRGDGSAYIPLRASSINLGSSGTQFTIGSLGTVTKYNNVTTAGWGVPSIVAAARVVGATGAQASVATYTVGAADGSFEVQANVLVTTATTHAFTVTCTYTDEGNTARTLTLPFVLVAGSAIVNSVANGNGTVPYMGMGLEIRAKAATVITIATTGTFTTVTYNVDGSIRQIS